MKNFLAHFQSIVGPYSLTAIKVNPAPDLEWTCSIYRGGKRIGTAIKSAYLNTIELVIFDAMEDHALAIYADKAGPYGFESSMIFIQTVMGWVLQMKAARTAVRKGYLVACSTTTELDEHEMPKRFMISKNKANPAWLKAYTKTNKQHAVLNEQFA